MILISSIILGVIGCESNQSTVVSSDDGITRQFLQPAGQNILISQSRDQISDLASFATRVPLEQLRRRRGSEIVRLDQLSYFFRAPGGQSYLLAENPKAFVRGAPELTCPVEVATKATANAPATAAIEAALTTCFDELDVLGKADTCGCQLLAHDAVVHADLAAFEYAVDLPVRLFRDGRLDSITYFGRDIVTTDLEQGVVVGPEDAPIVTVLYDPDSMRVTASFPSGVQTSGTRTLSGITRGRLVQSFTLTTPDGAPLRVIVGP